MANADVVASRPRHQGDLALFGGGPVLGPGDLKPYRSMGAAEREAVDRVMDRDCLSGFVGSPGPEFNGGPEVQMFEAEWRERYGVRHAISVNSNTTGLMAAMGAIGISPGDEVITTPYSMSATAIAPLFYGGVPVFADIEKETFGLDPKAVEAAITPRTRAILVTNLFGHPARLWDLRSIADRHGLYLVEDNAQAPMSFDNGAVVGAIGDIGVFSLNRHKHIQTGEGGVCVTNSDELAQRLSLIRNHGENLSAEVESGDLSNLLGLNLRLTELSAAVGRAQLANAEIHIGHRERACAQWNQAIANINGLRVPVVRTGCRHNYYCWPLLYDAGQTGVSRDRFAEALQAEGVPCRAGYVEPLYMLPVFQKRMAIGRDGFPFNLTNQSYRRGMCPVTEGVQDEELILVIPCPFELDPSAVQKISSAIIKVHGRLDALRAST